MTTRKNARTRNRPPIRVIGYVRISVDRDDETSTTTQEADIRRYCELHRYELVDVVVERGVSAFHHPFAKRPEGRKVLDAIEAGAANMVASWKLDRAFRNARDAHNVVYDIAQHGGFYASVTQGIDTTQDTGPLLLALFAAVAEMESTTKSDRTAEWQEHRKATGATPTGPRPYGYRRERNRLIVDEDEAAVLKRMAAAILAGESLRSLIAGLTADGITTKAGRPWTHRSIAGVLTGPTVAGLRELDGTFVVSDTWEPILDRQTWDDVRAVLLDPARRTTPGPARRWLLSGLATCGRNGCGAAMKLAPHSKGAPRYGCPTCGQSIDAPQTDQLVSRSVLELLDSRTWKRLRRRGRHVDTSAMEQRLVELAHKLANHEIQQEVWEVLNAGVMRDIAEATAAPVTLPNVDDIRAAWPGLPIEARRLVLTAAASVVIAPPTKRMNRYDENRVQLDFVD